MNRVFEFLMWLFADRPVPFRQRGYYHRDDLIGGRWP